MIWTTVIIFMAMVIFLIIVGIIDGNRFIVMREEFLMPNLKKECTFVMISDLHNKEYGMQNDLVINSIDKINPDFIVIAGDLVTSHVKESTAPGERLINALSQKYKIYYAPGNHETKIKDCPEMFGDKYEKLIKAIEHSNVKILDNKHCSIEEFGIELTGLELEREYFARFRKKPMEKGCLEHRVGTVNADFCNILIAHNPIYFEEYAKWGADLVLSGHVHGGIMRLPLVGGVVSPSYTLFPKYDGGVFHHEKSTMLLGRGLGAHTITLRFFNPAELHAVTLLPMDKLK